MKILGKMRWQNGRLQIWNWWRREWKDFTSYAWAKNLERCGKDQLKAINSDYSRLMGDETMSKELLSRPLHSPGWFVYLTLRKCGFELVKSETLEVEVLEDAA